MEKMSKPKDELREVLNKLACMCIVEHQHQHDLNGPCDCEKHVIEAHAAIIQMIPKERECEECGVSMGDCGCSSFNLCRSELLERFRDVARNPGG